MIGPHCVADDFRWDTVSVVMGLIAVHGRILSQLLPKLTMPFGITDVAAIKYLHLIDPRRRDEVEACLAVT